MCGISGRIFIKVFIHLKKLFACSCEPTAPFAPAAAACR